MVRLCFLFSRRQTKNTELKKLKNFAINFKLNSLFFNIYLRQSFRKLSWKDWINSGLWLQELCVYRFSFTVCRQQLHKKKGTNVSSSILRYIRLTSVVTKEEDSYFTDMSLKKKKCQEQESWHFSLLTTEAGRGRAASFYEGCSKLQVLSSIVQDLWFVQNPSKVFSLRCILLEVCNKLHNPCVEESEFYFVLWAFNYHFL